MQFFCQKSLSFNAVIPAQAGIQFSRKIQNGLPPARE
jgi:hypothetical protein